VFSSSLADTLRLWPTTVNFSDFFPIPIVYTGDEVYPVSAFYLSVPLNSNGVVAYTSSKHVYLRKYTSGSFSETDAGPGDLAVDINNLNHLLIAERISPSTLYPSFDWFWQLGVRTPLDFRATALNDSDVVVGVNVYPLAPNADYAYRPVRWTRVGGMRPLALPPVPLADPARFSSGEVIRAVATDINNRGEIVGWVEFRYHLVNPPPGRLFVDVPHGLYWAPDGQVTDLFYAVQRNAAVDKVYAINDHGSMAASGQVAPTSRDCRLGECEYAGLDAAPIRLTPQRPP
jgi:hypothetical protein